MLQICSFHAFRWFSFFLHGKSPVIYCTAFASHQRPNIVKRAFCILAERFLHYRTQFPKIKKRDCTSAVSLYCDCFATISYYPPVLQPFRFPLFHLRYPRAMFPIQDLVLHARKSDSSPSDATSPETVTAVIL